MSEPVSGTGMVAAPGGYPCIPGGMAGDGK